MKCILLLAAVYSLIIHQWNKENGTTESVAPIAVKAAPAPVPVKNTSPVSFTANTQFVALHTFLKLNK